MGNTSPSTLLQLESGFKRFSSAASIIVCGLMTLRKEETVKAIADIVKGIAGIALTIAGIVKQVAGIPLTVAGIVKQVA